MLTILDGVLWPTASVILHFFHSDRYPILDYRAIWSVDADDSFEYNLDNWLQYVTFCRKIADQASVDMRTLDKALWQFSKDNQQ